MLWSVYAIVCTTCATSAQFEGKEVIVCDDNIGQLTLHCTNTICWPLLPSVCTVFVSSMFTRFRFRSISFAVVVVLNIAGIWFCIRLLIFKMNYLDCFDWTTQTLSQFHMVRSLNYFHVIKFLFKQHFKFENGWFCFDFFCKCTLKSHFVCSSGYWQLFLHQIQFFFTLKCHLQGDFSSKNCNSLFYH